LQICIFGIALKQALYNQYYCTIILHNIIDAFFRQFKTNSQYSLEAINNIAEYQKLINNIDYLELALSSYYFFAYLFIYNIAEVSL